MSAALSNESEELLSWLAVEKGRAANTLAAYRRDLAAYEEFLRGRGMALVMSPSPSSSTTSPS